MITPVRSDGQGGEQIHAVKRMQEIDDETHQVFESVSHLTSQKYHL